MLRLTTLTLASALASSLGAQSFTVNITLENLGPSGGLYLTPVFTGFHDGSFDIFDAGTAASSALEDVAEIGVTSGLESLFAASQGSSGIFATTANGGPFAPGSSTSFQLTLDVSANRYLSFASMVIPSNDTFLGNDDAIELFDAMGNFNAVSLTYTGAMAYDAGTELNDASVGPAFVVGQVGTDGGAEGGVVMLQSDLSALDEFIGASLPVGGTLGSALSSSDLFRISVTAIPEPGMVGPLLGLAVLGLVIRRRRR